MANAKHQKMRDWVNERLSAAAEEIFAMFERTIVDYEEELSRSKAENQRKQKLLDAVLSPSVQLPRAVLHAPSTTPDITETPQIKEEPEELSIKGGFCIKQEEEEHPVPVPEFCVVNVKTEEPSLLLQTELKEETQEEYTKPHVESETDGDTEHSSDTDSEDDRRPPLGYSSAQMETKAGGDSNKQTQIRDQSKAAPNSGPSPKNKPTPETSSSVKNVPGTAEGTETKKHQCPVCNKRFLYKYQLEVHLRVHTGERPYTCTICNKSLSCQTSLDVHTRQHATKQSFSCPICNKVLSSKTSVIVHSRQHKEAKTFSCSVCKKAFAQQCILQLHMKTHTGGK